MLVISLRQRELVRRLLNESLHAAVSSHPTVTRKLVQPGGYHDTEFEACSGYHRDGHAADTHPTPNGRPGLY